MFVYQEIVASIQEDNRDEEEIQLIDFSSQ
jgi:hypothetical protein